MILEWKELEFPELLTPQLPSDDAPTKSPFPAKVSLAASYVPDQPFENLYDEKTAFSHGTLFKALDFPFYGAKPIRKGTFV